MKNVFGTEENLKLYHKNGEIAYTFYKNSSGYSWTATYDDQGRVTSYKDSDGMSWKKTYEDGAYKQIDL